MSRDLKMQVQNYLDEIGRQLPKDYPNKQQILHMIRNDLDIYLQEHPDAGFMDAEEEFGNASEMVDSLMKQLPGAAIHAALRKKRRRQRILTALSVLLLIVLGYMGNYLYLLWDASEVTIEKVISTYDTELNIE